MGAFFGSADSKRVSDTETKKAKKHRGQTVAHPRVFFVRAANKGLMLDAVCKSGEYRT